MAEPGLPAARSAADEGGVAAADVDALRRRVLNVVGHELRTPSTTIRGLAEALLHADDDSVRSQLLPALVASARRLEKLVDDLLLAAGVSTAMPVGESVPTPVAGAIAEAWQAAGLGERRSVAPAGAGGAMSGASVLAPPGAVASVLERLFENAARYGDGEPDVAVRRGDSTVVIEVKGGSAGHGQDLRLAFEAFYRGEAAVTAAPGLGLGLAVARAIARHSGGDVTLRDEDGTVVADLELPVAPEAGA